MGSVSRRLRRLERKADAKSAKRTPRRRRRIIDPRTFMESPHYMNARDVLYPEVLDIFVEINSGDYQEAVLAGAIGWGKTTIGLYTVAYQLYVISCMEAPQKTFGLDQASAIVFILQSVTADAATKVMYDDLRKILESAPYFQTHFQFYTKIQSEMRFPNNIVIRSVSGHHTSTLGQNIIGGIIDEVNFMNIVSRSKREMDGTQYDQAMENYLSIDRRRRSRYLKEGHLPGIICLTSSERYRGQITDRKKEEARRQLAETGKSDIYIASKRIWETKPEGTFSNEEFELFIGDQTRQPRIILKEDPPLQADDEKLVDHIPMDFLDDFRLDIHRAMRDIAGHSTIGIRPFMPNLEAITASFGKLPSILSLESCDFDETSPTVSLKNIKYREEQRFVHIDSSLSQDSTGIACGYVPKFIKIPRGDGKEETLPIIVFDFVLEICPAPNSEISFARIRTMIYKLCEAGVNIIWVSMDSFQSADTIQILRREGFTTGRQSMDMSPLPYDISKTAIYDGRVYLPDHSKAHRELIGLERDPKTGRVDHPPHGSKDLADAIAGVIYGLTNRTDTWVYHGIPLSEVPPSLGSAKDFERRSLSPESENNWV